MTSQTAFLPPHPKRHKSDLGSFSLLMSARHDLLSFWSEDSFRFQFMHRKIFNRTICIANTPELVKEVFITKKDIYDRKSPQMRKALEPVIGDGLFISDGEIWKQRRQLQHGLFTSQHVTRYTEVMTATSQEMVEQWASLPAGSEVSVLAEMGKLTSEVIARTLFGQSLGDDTATAVITTFADFQRAIEQIQFSNFLGLPPWMPFTGVNMGMARKSAKKLHGIVDGVIASSLKERPKGTLLDGLLSANEASGGEAISLEGIRNELIVLFMAGHETTANALSWVWYLLSQSPEVEAKLHAELDSVLNGRLPTYDDYEKLEYTRAVFEETMRLYPPVPILSREAGEDDMIRGKAIPKGSLMLVVPWLLHRHQAYWDNPDHFIPERFLAPNKRPDKFVYLPFSVGPRTCIGKMFGMVEAVMVIATLAQRFRLTLPQGTEVKHECRLTLRPLGGLPMKLEAR